MKKQFIQLSIILLACSAATFAQTRQPATASRPFIVKTKQQVSDITVTLSKKPGNTNEDILPAAGMQTRIAIFHDEKRENDMHEVHDGADDIYYVTNGSATLMMGGSLVDAAEISPGEWRAKTATGGQKVTIKKGDLVFVPRGTPHQRTATDKKFTMILVKIFSQQQK